MAQLHFWLLGPFRAWRGEQRIDDALPAQRLRALLSILLVEHGRFIPSEQIIEYLWPHMTPAAAANNLQAAVGRLRRWLEPGLARGSRSRYLLTEPEGYRFDAGDAYLDAPDFESALRLGQAAWRSRDLPAAQAALSRAAQLYRGPLFEELPYAEWLLPERERLREAHLKGLFMLGDCRLHLGDYQRATAVARQALQIDPYRENCARLLMESLAALGEQAAALAAYADCQARLAEAFDAPPSAETQRLRDDIAAGRYTAPAVTGKAAVTTLDLPFTGREDALTALQQAWRRRDRPIFISGEGGLGKTRLLRHFAAGLDAPVYQSRCAPHDAPFAPLLDAAAAYLQQRRPPAARLASLGALGPPLAEALPLLRRLWPACPAYQRLEAEAEERRLGQALTALLRQTAGDACFIFDDAHWLSPTSLDALAALLPLPPGAALFLFAYRPEELEGNAPLAEWLAQLQTNQAAAEIVLEPWTATEVLVAMRGATGLPDPAALAGQIYAITSGHPLFLAQSLHALADAGWLNRDEHGRWQSGDPATAEQQLDAILSDTLRELVLSRVERLQVEEREALEAAAVLGDYCTARALRHILRLETAPVEAALARLTRRRLLLAAAGAPARWEIAHHLIAEALLAALPASGARLLHRLAAEALADLHPPAATAVAAAVADHWRQAGGAPREAANWFILAGDWAAASFDPGRTQSYLAAAVALLSPPRREDRPLALDALRKLAQAQARTGQSQAAVASLKQALALAETAVERLSPLLALARIYEADLGDYEQALALLVEIETAVGDLPPEQQPTWRAAGLAIRGAIHYWRGEYVAGMAAARQTLSLEPGSPNEKRALRILANCLQKQGQTEEALAIYQQMLAKAETAADTREIEQAYMGRGNGHFAIGQLEQAWQNYEQAGATMARSGDRRRLSVKETNAGNTARLLGRLDIAEDSLRRAVALAEAVGAPYTQAVAGHLLGSTLALRGCLAEAEKIIREAISLAAGINAEVVAAQARISYAGYWLLVGERDRARREAETAVAVGDALGDNYCQREGRLLLAEAALDAGDCDQAQALAGAAREMAAAARQMIAVGRAERLLGQIAAEMGQDDAATTHLAQSEAIFRQTGAAIDLGLTLLAWSQTGGEATKQGEARALFRRAGASGLLSLADASRL